MLGLICSWCRWVFSKTCKIHFCFSGSRGCQARVLVLKVFFMSAFKCLSWIVKQKHLDGQQKLAQNEETYSASGGLVPVKMSLVRTVYAKGYEVAGKLIRLMSALAPIFLPKMEMAAWGAGAQGEWIGRVQLSKLRQTDSISADLTKIKWLLATNITAVSQAQYFKMLATTSLPRNS